MRLVILLTVVFASAACLAAEGGFDLKGVTLGASEADVTGRFPSLKCRDRSVAEVERMCAVAKDTYGGAEANLFFRLFDGKVSSMSVRYHSRDFASVLEAMKERFGLPSSEKTETLSDRKGAQYQNEVFTWKRGGEIALAEHYSGSLDRASIMFFSEASIEESTRRSRPEKREPASGLYTAAAAGNTNAIKELLAGGADPNTPLGGPGWTPLMIAAVEGHQEAVSILLKAGANANAKNNLGRTALMFASTHGYVEIAQVLLEHGAQPNVVPNDNTGWTALIVSARTGRIATVRLLLRHGADRTIKDKGGKTALDWAEAQGHADVARILTEVTTGK